MRGDPLAYPIVNLLHLLGLVLLVGGIGLVDLRIAGLFRQLPAAALSRALTPVAVSGLLLMVLTGPLLFAADARSLAANPILWRKLVLIGLALANAAAFRVARFDLQSPPPIARAMAILSIGLWLTAAALGRWIAYG